MPRPSQVRESYVESGECPECPDCSSPVSAATSVDFEDPNHPNRWKHRRRMAYASLISIIAVTAILLGPWVPTERVEKLSDLISWFYFSLASIVGAYMGFATWSGKVAKG